MAKPTPSLPEPQGPEPQRIAGFPSAAQTLQSFDGGHKAEVALYAPDRYRFFDDTAPYAPRISRGAGLSYCAASFLDGGNSVSHRAFDRILDYDSATGEVEVETGIDLGTLYRFLAHRGRHLPCHPGYGAISIGGCIAADVHGKNHVRDGTFARQVAAIELFHPSHGRLHLTRHATPDVFDLTIGGFGLTGHIIKARLRTQPLTSRMVERSSRACASFAESMDHLQAVQQSSDYAYTWHDMSRAGVGFGSGIVHWGNVTTDDAGRAPEPKRRERRSALLRRLPKGGLIGYQTTPILARLYRAKVQKELSKPKISHYDAVFPVHGSEGYFTLFGRRGFYEAQWLVPIDHIEPLVAHLEAAVRLDKLPIALASTKLFDADASLLRYSGKGISFTLNLPRTLSAEKALNDLDSFMLEIGARPNLIKDGRLSVAVVEASCPEIDQFRKRLNDFDPTRIFRSELSERLAL